MCGLKLPLLKLECVYMCVYVTYIPDIVSYVYTYTCIYIHFRFECLMAISSLLTPDRNTLEVYLTVFFS